VLCVTLNNSTVPVDPHTRKCLVLLYLATEGLLSQESFQTLRQATDSWQLAYPFPWYRSFAQRLQMDDLRGRDQDPPGQGQGRGRVFQVSDTNSSSSSDPANGAFNADFLRNLLSLASAPALSSLNNNNNINAELLRRILSSQQPVTTVSNPPVGESLESALRKEIVRVSTGGSEQNAQSNPLNALILNSISQLQANSGLINRPSSGPNNGPPSALNTGPVNSASRYPNDVPQSTADLSPEELHIVSLMRRNKTASQNTSSIPERATMPSGIEQQLTILIQLQQAQQGRASTAADALHPTFRETTEAGQPFSQQSSLDFLLRLQSDGSRLPDGLRQQHSLEHSQLPLYLQSDGLRLPEGLLQLQRQRQLQSLVGVAERQSSQQQALENLQYQQQGQSDRAMLPGGLLQAQQQGQQPSQQLSMEHLQYYHQLQQNDRAVLSDTHLQASAGASLFLSVAENASMPPDGSTEPTATSSSGAPTARRQRKKEAFPGKLYRLLADVESRGNSHIISFTPNGKAFKIHNPNAFMKDVAPHYFDQTHFTSFVRQLNLYGFDRVSHGHERGAFIHPNFLRGRELLASRIQRQIIPPRAKKHNPEAEET
jgi:hypothetical protein